MELQELFLKKTLADWVLHDLNTKKKYLNLETAYISDLNMYVIASQEDGTHIFLPFIHSQKLDMIRLECILTKLGETHENSVVHLAICDGASNVLYYTITPGFVDDPQNWNKKLANELDDGADSYLSN